MKRIAVFLILLLAARLAGAQQGLVVESFRLDPFDATAATTEHQVLDYNQNPCALVKVMIIDNTVNFQSDWIVRSDTRGKNEYWVYLCEGTRSLTVRSDFFLPTEVVFADYDPEIKGLKKLNTYVLTLSYKGEIEDGRVGVTFACNTPAAEYKIDGYATERNTHTFRIEPGEHTLEVTADGYQKLTTTIKVSPYLKRQEIALTLTPDQSLDALVAEGDRYYGEKNYTKALDLYRQAAAKGNAIAMRSLGYAYWFGTGVEKNYAEVLKWLKQGANKGDVECQTSLGNIYTVGEGVDKNSAEAIKWYRLAAEQGDAYAQAQVGAMYLDGEGVEQNNNEALKWLQFSANQNDMYGQAFLGRLYESAYGNYAKAAQFYEKAAEQGLPTAQNNIGRLYFVGNGVPQDYSKAIYWCTKAANQGNVYAQHNMGHAYYSGNGVPQDYAQAFEWFSKSANQGYVGAQYWLGVMCLMGYGVQVDYSKALFWFKKAANQGDVYSHYAIGYMYEMGLGVEKDIETAVQWYVAAAAQGSDAAIEALERLQE